MDKPCHLQSRYGRQFADPQLVQSYPHRPPYLDEIFSLLLSLTSSLARVLDLGAGTGDIARPLAPLGDLPAFKDRKVICPIK